MSDRVLIVGAGAIGGLLAAYLTAAGRNVNVLARGDNAKVLARDGIRLTLPDGASIHGRPGVCTDARACGEQDVVLLTTKAFSLGQAIAAARAAIGPRTLVVPAVNGLPWWFGSPDQPLRAVDPDGALARAVPYERLVGATVYAPTVRVSAGECRQSGPGKLILGPVLAGGDPAPAERVAAVFTGSRYAAEAIVDIRSAVWTKLVTNAAVNPLSALTGGRAIDVARDPQLGPIARAIMSEVAALARACGTTVHPTVEAQFTQSYERGVHKPSMLQDFEAGRPIELAAIVDAPLEMAAARGVAMPTLTAIGAAVRLKASLAGLLPPP